LNATRTSYITYNTHNAFANIHTVVNTVGHVKSAPTHHVHTHETSTALSSFGRRNSLPCAMREDNLRLVSRKLGGACEASLPSLVGLWSLGSRGRHESRGGGTGARRSAQWRRGPAGLNAEAEHPILLLSTLSTVFRCCDDMR
jgi:hypothetical protein